MTRSTHFNLYFLAFLIHYEKERENALKKKKKKREK